MSIFKANWIVLQSKKNNQWNFLYDVFFYEFWILSVTKSTRKKEKTLDIWDILSCELLSSSSKLLPSISNFKKKESFYHANSYTHMENFMRTCAYFLHKIPKKYPHHTLWNFLQESIVSKHSFSQEYYCLIILKFDATLWKLGDTHENEVTQKVLKFIHQSNNLKDLYRLKNIPQSTLEDLKKLLN